MRANARSLLIFTQVFVPVFLGIAGFSAQASEQIDVYLNEVVGPVMYRGSGFLEGAFTMDQPDDELLLPLKPQRVRSREKYLETVYKKCLELDISIEVIATDTPFWKSYKMDGTDDYEALDKYFEDLVRRMLDRGLSGIDYCVFLDSDSPWINWNEETDAYFLDVYKRAYQIIKRTDPEASIVGPGSHWGPITSWWKERQGDYTWFIRRFIDFTIENDCVPDIISWHDYSMDGLGITRDATVIREYLKKKGLPDLPFEQDDLGAKDSVFRPGIFASYLANIERSRILYTVKCCWNRDCQGGTLQGMLTKEDRQPRSLWWMYKAYGDLEGDIVKVTESKTVDAIVAVDKNPTAARAVIGRFKEDSEPVRVRFHGLNRNVRSVKVVAERIENTEDQPLRNPEQTINKNMPVKNGVLNVMLEDLGPFDAYTIVITAP